LQAKQLYKNMISSLQHHTACQHKIPNKTLFEPTICSILKGGRMAEKKLKLKPDVVISNYWQNNEQFADLFNAVLYDGRQVIKPEDLEDADTDESSVFEHRDYAESVKASRDNIKICKKSKKYNVGLMLLGLEGQQSIHYAMPLRVMGYDYGTYKKQYDSNAAKYKDSSGLTGDEYLSRMKATDKFVPVITLVVYYGEKPWDGALSLHDMLDIPKGMEQFVNDYKVILIETRDNNLKFHNVNNRDLFEMLRILTNNSISKKKSREEAARYANEHHSDKSVLTTVAGITNLNIAFERRDDTMYSVFQDLVDQGKIEGIIETLYDFGLSDNDIIAKLQEKLNVSLQQAQEYLDTFKKHEPLF
jgi:hypothetical protein